MDLFDLTVDPGQLRQRVALQSFASTPDAFGQLQPTWTTLKTFWAFVKPLGGRELANAQQIKAEVSHAIVTWWDSGLTVSPTLRLLLGSRVFGIQAALNVEERNVKLVILATEQVTPQ